MNNPTRVIGFVNAAHFIDHYSMLIFAAAVIVMGALQDRQERGGAVQREGLVVQVDRGSCRRLAHFADT